MALDLGDTLYAMGLLILEILFSYPFEKTIYFRMDSRF
jgi:hypothetical protein